MERLAKDEYWHVRETVAENANTPTKILAMLAKDKKVCVRDAVARNKNTPAEILAKLAEEDVYWDVRYDARDNLEGRKK